MNQKIEIFSFVALPSPNTKKNHPKWFLGKDFSSQAFPRKIKDQNPSISEYFTKTFLKCPRDRLETTWCNVGLSGRKNVLRKLLRSPHRLRLFVSFCESSDWDWMKYTRCERLLLLKAFFLVFVFVVVVVFSSLENYFGFRTTNVRVKTDHSVSLRRNKTFWTFQKRFVFFYNCAFDLWIDFVSSASPSFAGLN